MPPPPACEEATGEPRPHPGAAVSHEFLERTTWHVAQHLRQVYALLEIMGIIPNRPLAETAFAGLPLPKQVW